MAAAHAGTGGAFAPACSGAAGPQPGEPGRRPVASSAISAEQDDIDAGLAGIAPLGRFALANPDIVDRLRLDAPLNELDPTTLYVGGAAEYTDYPTLARA